MKNEEQKDEVDLQQATKNLVLSELEKNGVIAYMKAKIKKSIIDIIDQQKDSTKQKIDFDYITPLHRQNKSREIVLICHLIKEFLHFYEMEYTFPIFENESNIKETVKRETLLKEFSLTESKEEPKPVLLQLIEDIKGKNKQLDDLLRNTAKNVGNTFGDGFSSLNQYGTNEETLKSKLGGESNYTNPIVPNKKQLPSISYVNKSVEINNSSGSGTETENQKFNTLNINEVYKQDNQKELTADDVLNKPKPQPVDPLEGHDTTENKLSIDNYNTNANKYDDEFQEMILEEIPSNKKDDDNGIGNSGSLNSYGYDQSVHNYNLNDFDHVESAEKP